MSTILRIYSPDDVRSDGYPPEWATGNPAIKDLVRGLADHRCVRCLHPYWKGDGEWSRCDERCVHPGPARWKTSEGWRAVEDEGTARELIYEHGARVEAQWRILTVHHLNGVKYDCRWWNLAALCQRCHLTIQGKVRMERVYPWPHSEWFKPYAAGYYASVYQGRDLTREQTMAELDELLALECAA